MAAKANGSMPKDDRRPDILKQQNDILLSQLNAGVKDLKSMVLISSNNTKLLRHSFKLNNENSNGEYKRSRDRGETASKLPFSSEDEIKKNAKRNRKILKSSRVSSTPKIAPKKSYINTEQRKILTPQNKQHSILLADTGNLKPKKSVKSTSGSFHPKAILLDVGNSKTHKASKVSFSPMINTKHVVSEKENFDTTMMGRDWIAGLIDNDSLDKDRPNKFFEDLSKFRKSNWNECKSTAIADSSVCQPPLPLTTAAIPTENYPLCCTGNGAYMLNNRLNPVPIHGPFSGCPICKVKPRSQYDKDGFVRVSIPRSTVKSPYRLRPHRRKSFEPSDSVALSMHCLAGWDAAKPSCIRGPANIDLASHAAKSGLTSLKSWSGEG